MGIIDFLKEKGIQFQGAVGDVSAILGVAPVQWDHTRRPGLLWRIPEPDLVPALERVTISGMFAKKQPIVVRENERAIVLQNGKFYVEVPPGKADLSKVPLRETLEVIWVTMSQTQFKWGVGGVPTRDGITVGGHGVVRVRIADATRFALSLAGAQQFTEDKIRDWLRTHVVSIMRQQFATRPASELQVERESLTSACGEKLTPLLNDWGLQFVTLEVEELNLPPEYRHLLQAVGSAGLQRQKTILETQLQADAALIEAQARANASLVEGTAQLQLQAVALHNGLDPVKMEVAKALLEFARTPSSGGSMISGDLNKPQVFAALAGGLLNPAVAPHLKTPAPNSGPNEATNVPAVSAPVEILSTSQAMLTAAANASAQEPVATPAAAPVSTIAEIEAVIDGLDQQLALGKIEQATYDRLLRKYEARLSALKDAIA